MDKMNIKEIQDFIDLQISALEKKYGLEKDKEKDNWAYALKVGEELGEVYDVLLKMKGYQRKEKIEEDKSKIEEEIADLIITSFILARSMNLDLDKIIRNKMEYLKNR